MLIILYNGLYYFISTDNLSVRILGVTMKYFDLFALVVALVLFFLYFFFFLTARREYEKIDPPRS